MATPTVKAVVEVDMTVNVMDFFRTQRYLVVANQGRMVLRIFRNHFAFRVFKLGGKLGGVG